MGFLGLDFDVHIEDYRSNPFEFFKDPAGWLYSDWTEEKYKAYLGLHTVRPIGLYMDYLLDKRATSEYLNRYGMDYTDVHDPRKLPSTSSAVALNGYALNFASRNISRLYR